MSLAKRALGGSHRTLNQDSPYTQIANAGSRAQIETTSRWPRCPVCESVSVLAWGYLEYSIYQCSRCSLQFVDPMLSGSLDYYRHISSDILRGAISDQIHPGFRFTVESLKRTFNDFPRPAPSRLLDLGCGPGLVLYEMSKLGFDCLGIDFNPDLVGVANEHFGVNAQVGSIEDLNATSLRFDVVLLIHVLEHVERPSALLQTIHHLLNPSGLLVVEVPNRDRFTVRRSLLRGDFPAGEYPPHHLTFWSPASLLFALAAAGLTTVRCYARPIEREQIDLFLASTFGAAARPFYSRLAPAFQRLAELARLAGDSIFAVAHLGE